MTKTRRERQNDPMWVIQLFFWRKGALLSNKNRDTIRKLFAASVLVVIGYVTGQIGIAAYGVSQAVEAATSELQINRSAEDEPYAKPREVE